MKRFPHVAVILTAVLLVAADKKPALSQPGTGVAIVDIGYIFKNDPDFKQQMEKLRNEVEAVDQQLSKEYEAIRKLAQQLQELDEDSPQVGKLEDEIAIRKVVLKSKTKTQRKTFVEKETQIRYDEYLKIQSCVKGFAERNGISLVLRFSSDQTDPDKSPKTKLAEINRRVIYGNERIDITKQILETLKDSNPPTAKSPMSE